jgi:hypothetical protein
VKPSRTGDAAPLNDTQRDYFASFGEPAHEILAEIYERLEWRIRPVIAHLPEDEIIRLLCRMAWLKYKYEGAEALRRTPARSEEPPGF